MVARNGIADASLVSVPGEPGARLRFDAAASWGRLCDEVARRYGWRPRLTSAGDAFRPYDVQERIFRQRYTSSGSTSVDRVGKWWDSNGNGVPEAWFRLPIYATAAVPGTSNHGWGLACDVTALGGFNGARYRQFATVAPAHGWDNGEGASIGEAWHWRYRPENDRHRDATTVSNTHPTNGSTIPTASGDLPDALTPEDPLMALTQPEADALKDDARQSREALTRIESWLKGDGVIHTKLDQINTKADTLVTGLTGVAQNVDDIEGGVAGFPALASAITSGEPDAAAIAAELRDTLGPDVARAVVVALHAALES